MNWEWHLQLGLSSLSRGLEYAREERVRSELLCLEFPHFFTDLWLPMSISSLSAAQAWCQIGWIDFIYLYFGLVYFFIKISFRDWKEPTSPLSCRIWMSGLRANVLSLFFSKCVLIFFLFFLFKCWFISTLLPMLMSNSERELSKSSFIRRWIKLKCHRQERSWLP